ncbi:MAG: hypothetical protein LBU36_06415 [Clostridiales bacterium]|nr:hypothetical protein [Clostridiales bacterium]
MSDEDAKVMLLERLKDRWDVDFEIVSFGRSNGDACRYGFTVRPAGTEDESRGYASIVTDPKYLDSDALYQKRDKFFREADRYFNYVIREYIEKYFSGLIKEVSPENKVYYIGRPEYVYAGFDKNSTAQDFLESEAGRHIDLQLYIPYAGITDADESMYIKQDTDILKECSLLPPFLAASCKPLLTHDFPKPLSAQLPQKTVNFSKKKDQAKIKHTLGKTTKNTAQKSSARSRNGANCRTSGRERGALCYGKTRIFRRLPGDGL